MVVGDSVWDMLAAQRARGLCVGLLSGGYGRDELERAGACRVYEDPADLLRHIDEVGRKRGADAWRPVGAQMVIPPSQPLQYRAPSTTFHS